MIQWQELFACLGRRWRRRGAFFIALGGGPGSGKGTQASLLSQALGIRHVSAGELLRKEIEKDSAAGRQAAPYVQEGKLVPTALILSLVRQELDLAAYDRGAILDGIPRRLESALLLDDYLSRYGCAVSLYLFLQVSDQDLIERLSLRYMCSNKACERHRRPYHLKFDPPGLDNSCLLCGSEVIRRKDDHVDAIRERLEVFHQESLKVREHYATRGVLHVVQADNTMSKDDVLKETLKAAALARSKRRSCFLAS